jgi:hypothetical protein
MAIYKLFPSKDATIYSQYPVMNTGRDEILETSLEVNGTPSSLPQTSRILIQFDSEEITNLFSTKINNAVWESNLRLFTANTEGLNSSTTLEIYPLSGSWNMGLGKFGDNPSGSNGVSWIYQASSGSQPWATSGFSSFVTASYSSSTQPGGGTWYTGSSNNTVLPLSSSQEFSFYTSKDLNINVTNIVKAWVSGTIENEGFIIKQKDEFINNINVQPILKYFSRDTHTIYPPQLEFKWVDYIFNTGSSNQTILNILPATLTLSENPGIFYPNSINRFRVNSRPEYPARVYQTASIYSTYSYLPTASYYAIQDLSTNEFVIDFNEQFTQISADSTSNYFDIYMSGLEPERYYKIVIKTTINGSTLIFDNNYYFKVING